MQLYYNVKNDLFFKFCVVFMFMMMMMLTTMMMLLNMCGRIPRHHGIGFTSQFHNTVKPIPRCMWNWFAKNNSTTPWNQFHGAVELNCNTKAALPRCRDIISTTNWTNFTDLLNKFHGAMELVSQITQTRGMNSTAHVIPHIVYLWSALINHNKACLNE